MSLSSLIYISYAIYAVKKQHFLCFENLRIFVDRSQFNNDFIHYNFIVLGRTQLSEELKTSISKLSRASVVRLKNERIDLCSHTDALKIHLSRNDLTLSYYDYYFFTNCGMRGPYFRHKSINKGDSSSWLKPFIFAMSNVTKAVGPTISCEIFPHVQSYAIMLDAVSVSFAFKIWSCERFNISANHRMNSTEKLHLINSTEVELSRVLLRNGYNIASITMYQNVDFRDDSTSKCTFSGNPTACFPPSCLSLDPCDLVAVKYGGGVWGWLSPHLKGRITALDGMWSSSQDMCF